MQYIRLHWSIVHFMVLLGFVLLKYKHQAFAGKVLT